jgi:putative DNA primase/helicase
MSAMNRMKCPAHGGGDPNCAVWRDQRGRLHAKCWSRNCSERAILQGLGELPARFVPDAYRDPDQSRAMALRLWNASREAKGTLAYRYLRRRGITISPPASLRFHPALKHLSGTYLPGLVAAVEDYRGLFVGVHRTWLNTDGSDKADVAPQKAALGPIAGSVIRLTPELAERIAVTEGLETGLSILQATGIVTWVALSTSGLCSLRLPDSVREVIICADADEPGELAAQSGARRLMYEGRKVRIARTGRPGADFNDLRL